MEDETQTTIDCLETELVETMVRLNDGKAINARNRYEIRGDQ